MAEPVGPGESAGAGAGWIRHRGVIIEIEEPQADTDPADYEEYCDNPEIARQVDDDKACGEKTGHRTHYAAALDGVADAGIHLKSGKHDERGDDEGQEHEMRGGAVIDHVDRGKGGRPVDQAGIAQERAGEDDDGSAAIERVRNELAIVSPSPARPLPTGCSRLGD
jgi:hypothetical protein